MVLQICWDDSCEQARRAAARGYPEKGERRKKRRERIKEERRKKRRERIKKRE